MIKFVTRDRDGAVLIGLGLEQANWNLLLEGKPIHVDAAAVDELLAGAGRQPGDKVAIVIVGAPDIADLQAMLTPLVGPDTMLRIPPGDND